VVLGTVTRLSPVQALLSIGVVDGVPLPAGEEFVGVVRTQDVRATEKDRVKIGDCFRGGDVVRGVVVRIFCSTAAPMQTKFQMSLGDARSYFVTTARNDLGVIFATSEAGRKAMLAGHGPNSHLRTGSTLEPVSWQEMRCAKTGRLEKRKCAKPEDL